MPAKNSLRAVNLLYLLVICLEISNLLFMWLPQFMRMILNEIFFVFLPAYLYLRITRQPVAERVRWRWPGWKIATASLLMGAGLYPLSAVSAGVFLNLLGYTNFTMPADSVPTTLPAALLAVVAYAVMAPLCEEFLFRGVIQPVYEQRSPKLAVYFGGLLFVVFHLSLLQGLSIILLALALGLVNYRARSLQASILTHFGANALAALVLTEGVFKTGFQSFIISIPAVVGGLVITAAALFTLLRLTRRRDFELDGQGAPALPAPAARWNWLAQGWPLLAAGLLYLGMTGAEFTVSRQGTAAAPPLEVSGAPWQERGEWSYEIRNVADTVVGGGECTLTPGAEGWSVECSSQVQAYEVKLGNSTFSSSGGERIDTLSWEAASGRFQNGSSVLSLSDGSYGSELAWSLEPEEIAIRMTVRGEAEQDISLPLADTPLADDSTLVIACEYTWPWQIAGIRFESGTKGRLVRFHPYAWRNETQDSGPLAEDRLVTVTGPEDVTTPAGSFSAWKVSLGEDQAAWYEVGGRTLVKFNNGIETWYLIE